MDAVSTVIKYVIVGHKFALCAKKSVIPIWNARSTIDVCLTSDIRYQVIEAIHLVIF